MGNDRRRTACLAYDLGITGGGERYSFASLAELLAFLESAMQAEANSAALQPATVQPAAGQPATVQPAPAGP